MGRKFIIGGRETHEQVRYAAAASPPRKVVLEWKIIDEKQRTLKIQIY